MEEGLDVLFAKSRASSPVDGCWEGATSVEADSKVQAEERRGAERRGRRAEDVREQSPGRFPATRQSEVSPRLNISGELLLVRQPEWPWRNRVWVWRTMDGSEPEARPQTPDPRLRHLADQGREQPKGPRPKRRPQRAHGRPGAGGGDGVNCLTPFARRRPICRPRHGAFSKNSAPPLSCSLAHPHAPPVPHRRCHRACGLSS